VDQRDAAAVRIEARGLELRAPDHDVEMDHRAVDTPGRRLRTRAAEAAAEGDVRGGVLVEQGVVVDAPALADARRGVYERDLAEPPSRPIGVDERCNEVAIVVRVGLEPDEPPLRELAADPSRKSKKIVVNI